jgi:hypothetical protein
MLHVHAVASLWDSPCSLLVDAHGLMCVYTCMRCAGAGREARTPRGAAPGQAACAACRRVHPAGHHGGKREPRHEHESLFRRARARAGVLDATQEARISQVRAAALGALAALLPAAGGGAALPPELRARVRGRLEEAAAGEKASVIRAQAASVLALLAGARQ